MVNGTLTPEQKGVLKTIIEWLNRESAPTLTLGGYAGTGKTTLTGILRLLIARSRPKARVAFCAYTGKAARVLYTALTAAGAGFKGDSVSTIHGLIYSPIAESGGRVTGWRRKESLKADLIVVYEASMVTAEIWDDLTGYGIPVLAVGDHGQLPPIGGHFNLMAKPELRLETIHRQAAGNPIIHLSMLARETGQIPVGTFGPGVRKLNRYDAASGQEVEEMLRGGTESLMILTGYNQSRLRLNREIRTYREMEGDKPHPGDRVIALRNNWETGIYNGMTGRVKRLIPMTDEGEVHWYDAEILMDDEGYLYSGKISSHQFNQPGTLTEYHGLKGKALGDLFDFGYALTVHKAQGSQSPGVLLFEERNKHMSDDDWRRWLYTGITRAEERLTIVGLP